MKDTVHKVIRSKVDSYRIDLPCTEEGCSGSMEHAHTGPVLTSYPPQYPHMCTECGFQMYITGQTYPYIENGILA